MEYCRVFMWEACTMNVTGSIPSHAPFRHQRPHQTLGISPQLTSSNILHLLFHGVHFPVILFLSLPSLTSHVQESQRAGVRMYQVNNIMTRWSACVNHYLSLSHTPDRSPTTLLMRWRIISVCLGLLAAWRWTFW